MQLGPSSLRFWENLPFWISKKKLKKTHMWTFPTFPATTSEFVPQKSQIFTIPFTFNNISEQATRAIGSAEGINSLLSAPEFSGKKHRFPDICRYAYRKNADMEETWHKSRFDFLYPITIISFIQAWWYMISFIPALLKKNQNKNRLIPNSYRLISSQLHQSNLRKLGHHRRTVSETNVRS